MSTKIRGEVRRAQLITTYGVGSIVALRDESFMVAGTDRWDISRPDLHEPLLERALGVSGFVLPPASDAGHDVPVVRFPRWSSCPTCRRLAKHTELASNYDNHCTQCETKLVPSRFVMACERGHIDDFPYERWVHGGAPRREGPHLLTIEVSGRSSSLRDVVIRCRCGDARDLDGAFAKFALRDVTRCFGQRPWLSDQEGQCDAQPRVLQRGASNVWFSIVRSAISIPPWSEGAFEILNQHWGVLSNIPAVALAPTLEGMGLAKPGQFTVEDLVAAVHARLSGEDSNASMSFDEIRRQEYAALSRGRHEQAVKQEFVCVEAGGQSSTVMTMLDSVMVVRRLREIRALTGFSRVLPADDRDGSADVTAPLANTDMDWLPAIEVRGEGVFLRLAMSRLQAWESRPDVVDRVANIRGQYEAMARARGAEPERQITPRLILLHTLAHVLIDQWALDSGYAASSLRERLYSSNEMAGLLIYTATSDAAGSLGGVAAQAQPARLGASLADAIDRASWCSSDPLCIEADGSGVDALNLGACHSCCLLPEVSCEEMNVFLDRAVLVGTPGNAAMGYFVGV